MDGEVLLTPRQPGQPREGFRYAARSAPTGAEFAVHVRRGLGFDDVDTPIVMFEEGPLWLHFGGSAYETALVRLLPSLRSRAGLAGLAVSGRLTDEQLYRTAAQEIPLLDPVEEIAQSVEPTLSPGPYHRLLPESCRQRITTDLFDMQRFRTWIANRHVWELPLDDSRLDEVRAALAGHV